MLARRARCDCRNIAARHDRGLAGRAFFCEGLGLGWRQAFGCGRSHFGAPICALYSRGHSGRRRCAEPQREPEYPYIGLLVSGGHTMVCLVRSYRKVEVLGASIDDACGEAFDKVAKHYGLGYPGGAVIDRLAQHGDASAYRFPQPKLKSRHRDLDFSFSGLKSAAIWQHAQFLERGKEAGLENLLASYQKAIVDMLLDRVRVAAARTGVRRVAIGGGVAANSYLRRELETLRQSHGWRLFCPSLKYCTDNAVMIAGIAAEYVREGRFADLSCPAHSRVEHFRSQPKRR